ncbi:sigma-70 family RNA polymerase sigma factor [Pseudomonas sp. App30]|uniref:sigma-70 family RNA polymerase sigma factor n=1 Tax=Pseudomonas sp. App30 TaxID=3068990 RepID=UPI003A80ECB0
MTSKLRGHPGFLEHYQELLGAWTRRLRDRARAEDLTHDAFVRVLETPAAEVQQPRAYLHQAARNIAVDGYRREDRRAALESLALAPDAAAGADPEAFVQAVQLADAVEKALDELPPNCRKVFVWQKLEGLSQAEIAERMGLSRNMVERYMMRALKHLRGHQAIRYVVAASIVAAAVWLGWFTQLRHDPAYQGQFATVLGERRQFDLPDGSHLELNSRTRLSVSFVDGQRQVTLQEGEAMFSVAHDPSRPFVVSAGAGTVTVTGTRFDVRRDPDQMQVAVESGTVRVQGHAAPVVLTAGLGSRIGEDGQVSPAVPVNTADLTAWRSGKLVFSAAPLSEVVREVSRYRQQPLHVSGKAAHLRLSSVFKADDTDALLRALPSILPVSVRTLADGSAEIIAR